MTGYFDFEPCILPGTYLLNGRDSPAERTLSLKTTLDSSFQKIRLIELYIRNVGANLLGFLIIVLLNLFTPLEFFKIQRAFLLSGGWVVILSFYPLVICIGITLQYIVQRPITQMINRMRQGLKIEAALEEGQTPYIESAGYYRPGQLCHVDQFNRPVRDIFHDI